MQIFFRPSVVSTLVGTALVSLLAGCGGSKPAPAAPQAAPKAVITAPVLTRDVPRYLDEIGTCAATESVAVQAQISGQITERNFADGADVKKGDLLFTVDPRPYQAILAQAEGTLAQNHAQLDLDNINLKRIVDLQKKQVVTPQDLDTAKTNVATDEAKIQSAEGAVAQAKVNLDFCSIRSPINGRAGLRQVDVGNIVNASSGSAVLLTIQKLDPIYTDFTISESDLPEVREFQSKNKLKVETDLPDDNNPARQGDLYFLDTSVAAGAGTIKARGITPNADHLLLPGAFVKVRLILETIKNAALVPSQAVQISQAGPFVFVVKSDNTLEQRPVKPGQRQGDLMVIEDGVKGGENVVVSGQLALSPGLKVTPQAIKPDQPAPGGAKGSS